ncbi:hypothetical protein Pint_05979 [Pistacia integerrima]|uniref:Uncharacterized protein n=1 Tax=Pistacia integerrima TaxID=434235 RepID=A0ACC0Z9J2_9ROSI|nr:hypothetical protein Pint_05979 [Pistacia integerrima]
MRKMVIKKKNSNTDSDEDDEIFYYRYASMAAPTSPCHHLRTHIQWTPQEIQGLKKLSPFQINGLRFEPRLLPHELRPPYALLHLRKDRSPPSLKDPATRKSRGVAFIQFVNIPDAQTAARAMHGKILNGRTVTASIAMDNGRAASFIKKRVYKDKSRCYECGVEGHLSYECPKNQLGPRERPEPKKVRRKFDGEDENENENESAIGFDDGNWASVVDDGAQERLIMGEEETEEKKKKVKRVSYFSDESGEDD